MKASWKRQVGGMMFVASLMGASTTTTGCDGDDGESSTSTSTSSSSTSSSSSSGAGGSGGSSCLEPSTYAALFTIEDSALCAVAVYTADEIISSYESAPTWGSHGGLLTVAKGAAMGSLALARWKAPSGASGALTKEKALIAAAIPGEWFAGAQAFDLPFFGWTAASWSAQFPATGGEALLLNGNAVAERYDVNSFFSVVGVGATSEGRMLYSGLSALDMPGDSKNGLYAADSCGTAAQMPRLVPNGDATCKAPSVVASWGESSGPVAVDGAGNVFAVMTSFSSGDQEARGFEASTVARGAPATDGVTLFKMPGFGSALAAIAPDEGGVGLLAFQPSDATTFAALDVIAQRYSATAGALKTEGNTSVLLKLTEAGTLLTLTADDQNRLWIGGPNGASGTLIVVLARAPK